MIYLSVVISLILLTVLLAPFWLGRGGLLQAGSSINSPTELQAIKTALLKRYLDDDLAFKSGNL